MASPGSPADMRGSPTLAPIHSPTRPLAPIPSFSVSPPRANRSRRGHPYSQVSRRVVSTGSIPNTQDPFVNISNGTAARPALTSTGSISYPVLPSFPVDGQRTYLDHRPRTSNSDVASMTVTPLRPTRARDRTMSSPRTPPRDPATWTPAEIDAEIERWIEMRLSDTERAEQGVGRNYVFDVELSTADSMTPPKRLVKIGCTTKSEYTRLCQIRNTCQHNITLGGGGGGQGHNAQLRRAGSIPLQTQTQNQDRQQPPPPSPPLPVRLYKRVEKLVHAELAAHVYHFDCACGTAHHEYFDIDRDTALRVQDKWRTFVTRHGEPYDQQGHLLPFWKHRLLHHHQHRLRQQHQYQHQHTRAQGHRGALATHQKWQALVEPSLCERLWYDGAVVVGKLWRCKWQALALAQAFFIACCLFPCFSAFILFSVVGLGVLVESGLEERLYSLGRLDGLQRLLFGSFVR